MTDPTTEERQIGIAALAAHRPPIEWWMSHVGDLTLDERGQALADLAAYAQGLEGITAQKAPYGISRAIEDGTCIAGASLLVAKASVEILQEAGFLTYPPNHGGFPWGLLLTCMLLIAPKMLGKATAGKVWGSVGDGLSKLIGRGRPAAPNEKDSP